MFLYHGTSEEIAINSLTDGLLPRCDSGAESLWEDCPSLPDFVYLTAAYAAYFAANAAIKNKRWGIVEVDINCLDEDQMYPDEDFLEQATRGQSGLAPDGLSMKERTEWFRDHIWGFQEYWRDSIENLGNAAYYGAIPPEAIRRISLFDPKSNPGISLAAVDPSISIMNYRFLGKNKYQALMKWFMGEEVTPPEFDPTLAFLYMDEEAQEAPEFEGFKQMAGMFGQQAKALEEMLENQSGLEIIENPSYDRFCEEWSD